MDEIKVVIRDGVPDDRNFILARWLNGQRYGNDYFEAIPADIYFKEYPPYIFRVLESPETCVRVACDEANQSWIAGFAVFSDAGIYWMNVRPGFRGRGIATLLLNGWKPTTIKSFTKVGLAIAKTHGLYFNPF